MKETYIRKSNDMIVSFLLNKHEFNITTMTQMYHTRCIIHDAFHAVFTIFPLLFTQYDHQLSLLWMFRGIIKSRIPIFTFYFVYHSSILKWYKYIITFLMKDTNLMHMSSVVWLLGPRFNIKMSSYQYRKSHCGDKTVVRSSYLHNGISYTGKMSYLYWIGTLMFWRREKQP